MSIPREVSRLMEETYMWGAFLSFAEDLHFAQNSSAAPLPPGAALSTGCTFPESRIDVPALGLPIPACCWAF